MKLRRFFYLFSILLSMVGTKAFAYDIAVENADGVTIYYNYINDGKELEVTYQVTYQGTYNHYGSVVIPKEVTYMNRTRKVTSIGESAFKSCYGLTSVTIPNSVTSIGGGAFTDCSRLTSVTIPNSVTSIGGGAFYCCSRLTSVTIPNSVTSIGDYAFYGCSRLTSVTIPNSVTSIGNDAFQYCSDLTSVTIPNSVTSIGESAFARCSGLTSVTIPNSVTSIGNYAFASCSRLTSVTIPNSVTSIGDYAFAGWDLPEVISKIENPFEISTSTFSNNTFLNASLYVPKGTVDKYEATEGWKKFAFIEEGNGSNSVAQVRANAVMIKTNGGEITIEGAYENTSITVYTLDGVQVGAATCRNGIAFINTNLKCDSIAIVKIGNKSVKVQIK